MAAAVKAKAYGLKRKRSKADKPSYKSLRAAKRQGVVPEFIPDSDIRTATAVAQLATPGVAAARPTTDDLSVIRVSKAAVKPTAPEPKESEDPPKPKAAEAKAPKVEEKKPAVVEAPKVTEEKVAYKKGVSKRLLKKQQQAEKRAAAEEKKQAQREEAKKVKAEQAKAREAKAKAQPPKPQAKAKPQPKAAQAAKASKQKRKQQTNKQVLTKRQQLLHELHGKHDERRAKLGYYLPTTMSENEAADLAVSCEFDLSHYLKCLLAGEPGRAQAYINTVTSYSKPVMKAIISLHSDEIRDALHAGVDPAESLHSSEALEPRFKLKFEDPQVRKSDTQLLYEEGGMHLYEFSQQVYVTIMEDGRVVEEGKFVREVEEYRTKAYIAWLERNYWPKRQVDLNAFDRRTGKVTNDFFLQQAYEPCPVMVGNLQVGTNFVLAERIIPLSWEVARFKHELRDSGSQDSRKNRGKKPLYGLVGVEYLEGLQPVDDSTPSAVAANDSAPWDEEVKDEGAPFVPLPNPKLEDQPQPKVSVLSTLRRKEEEILNWIKVRQNPKILTRATLDRITRPNPEYVFENHLGYLPDKGPAKWVERDGATLAKVFKASLASAVGPHMVGLRAEPDYRFDPGPPGVAEKEGKVIHAEHRWPSKVVNLTPSKPKQSVVEAVTHNQKQPLVVVATRKPVVYVLSVLVEHETAILQRVEHRKEMRAKARAKLAEILPDVPIGHRSMRMCRATIKGLTESTRKGWMHRWALDKRDQFEEQRLHSWFKAKIEDESQVNLWTTEYDAVRYDAWMDSAMRKQQRHEVTASEYQQHLKNMEDRWPSLVRPEECKVCERTVAERHAVWLELKREAEMKEACMERNAFGALTLNLSKFNAMKREAAQPKAKVKPAVKAAVIREPVVRASKPDQLNQGFTGGGQSSLALQSFTPNEIGEMQSRIEEKAVEILVWSSLKGLVPKDKIQSIINHWIVPGRLILRPT